MLNHIFSQKKSPRVKSLRRNILHRKNPESVRCPIVFLNYIRQVYMSSHYFLLHKDQKNKLSLAEPGTMRSIWHTAKSSKKKIYFYLKKNKYEKLGHMCIFYHLLHDWSFHLNFKYYWIKHMEKLSLYFFMSKRNKMLMKFSIHASWSTRLNR